MFNHDTTGVQESGEFTPIPAGRYDLRIEKTELKQSAKGFNQVNVTLTVEEGEYKGRKVWHLVTFLPPNNEGAGMAKHWLHCIGEEYEGKITVNPEQWGGVISCDVKIDDYTKKDGTPGKSNKITNIYLPENATKDINSGVPF